MPHHAVGPSRKCGGMLVLEGRAKDTIVLSTGLDQNNQSLLFTEFKIHKSIVGQYFVIMFTTYCPCLVFDVAYWKFGWISFVYLLHLTISFAGENVEPSEIEEAASRSNLISQIVVIGQVRD